MRTLDTNTQRPQSDPWRRLMVLPCAYQSHPSRQQRGTSGLSFYFSLITTHLTIMSLFPACSRKGKHRPYFMCLSFQHRHTHTPGLVCDSTRRFISCRPKRASSRTRRAYTRAAVARSIVNHTITNDPHDCKLHSWTVDDENTHPEPTARAMSREVTKGSARLCWPQSRTVVAGKGHKDRLDGTPFPRPLVL